MSHTPGVPVDGLGDIGYYENPIPDSEPDPNLIARFYNHKVRRFNAKGEFTHYEDEVWVEIRAKGQSKSSASHKKTKAHEYKFPREWKAFVERKGYGINGTPLDHLPFIGPSNSDNLRALGILTAEDLANLQESVMHNVPNARRMKAKAAAWLKMVDEAMKEAEEEVFEAAPKNVPIPDDSKTVKKTRKKRVSKK